MEIPYSELKLPANVEDTDRLFDANAMDLYRGIAQGPLAVDLYANVAPYGDFNESMFAEAPAYNGKFDKSSDDALTVLVAPKLIVEAEDSLEYFTQIAKLAQASLSKFYARDWKN